MFSEEIINSHKLIFIVAGICIYLAIPMMFAFLIRNQSNDSKSELTGVFLLLFLFFGWLAAFLLTVAPLLVLFVTAAMYLACVAYKKLAKIDS